MTSTPPTCWRPTPVRPPPRAPPTELPAALALGTGAAGPCGVAGGPPGGTVVVDGATRVGVPLAAVLAASGVGRVSVRDSRTGRRRRRDRRRADRGRRGPSALAGGRRRGPAGQSAHRPPARRADEAAPTWSSSPAPGPAPTRWSRRSATPACRTWWPPCAARSASSARWSCPGVTSCLRCARPAPPGRRPALARPRRAAHRRSELPPPSGATVTCLLTVATAAVQVLAYLDGVPRRPRSRRPSSCALRTSAPRPEVVPAPRLRLRGGRGRRLGIAAGPLPRATTVALPADVPPRQGEWAVASPELTRDDTAVPAGTAGAGEEDA